MQIVIEEARAFVNAEKTGIGQYYLNLKKLLKDLNTSPIIYEKNFLLTNNALLRRILYFFWVNTIFLFRIWKLSLKEEVIIIGVNYYIPFIKIPNTKYYPVIHDLIAVKYADNIPKWNAFIIKLTTNNAIKNGYKIITVSETSKKEIAALYNYPLDKILILYNTFSLDKNIQGDEEEVLNKYKINAKKYFLSVSSLSGHKNIKTLINSYTALSEDIQSEYKLVLAGGKNIPEELISAGNKNVIFTKFVDENTLKVLYKNAKFYIFPSKMEGFGIPIIDAQNFGIPVICSDIEVFKEVASEQGAVFCKPDEDNIKISIEKLLNNNKIETDLINQGKINISRFSEEIRKEQLKKVLYEN